MHSVGYNKYIDISLFKTGHSLFSRFIIRSIYIPIHFNIINLYSYDCLVDFITKLYKHGLFPSIGLRN